MSTALVLALLLAAPTSPAAAASKPRPGTKPPPSASACKPYSGAPDPAPPTVDPEPNRATSSGERAQVDRVKRRHQETVALSRAIEAPNALGEDLVTALVGPSDPAADAAERRDISPAWRGTAKLYCGRDAAPEIYKGCARARVVIGHDGSVWYREASAKDVLPASFCLEPDAPGSSPAWAFRTVAAVRPGAGHGDDATCFDVIPGQTYLLPPGSAADPRAAVTIWSARSPDSLKALRESTVKEAATAYRRRVHRAFVTWWVEQQPPGAIADVLCHAKTLARTRSEDATEAFVSARKRWNAVLSAFAAKMKHAPPKGATVAKEFAKAVDDAAADVAASAPDVPWTSGQWPARYDETLDGFARKTCDPANASPWCELAVRDEREGRDDALVAARAAIAYQPAERQVFPLFALAGELPTAVKGVRVIPVRSGEGQRTIDAEVPEERVAAFVTDLRSAQEKAVLLKGDAVKPVPSDLALVLATALRVGAVALGFAAPTSLAQPPAAAPGVLGTTPLGEACATRGQEKDEPPPLATCAGAAEARAEWSKACVAWSAVVAARATGGEPAVRAYAEAWIAAERLLARLKESSTCADLRPGEDPKPLVKDLQELRDAMGDGPIVPLVAAARPPQAKDVGPDPARPRSFAVVADRMEPERNYVVKVCAAEDAAKGPPKDCKLDTPDGVLADVRFRTPAKHRLVSVALEAAWNAPEDGRLPLGGYTYQARGAAGPDQLYVLAKRDRFEDPYTISALAVLYPLRSDPRRELRGLGVGAGPTLFQSGTNASFKQWSFRAVYEVQHPSLRGVLFSAGVSTRTLAIPVEPLGTVVSVPAGQAAPTPETRSRQARVWSLGIALDLALLGDAASAVTELFKPKENK